MKIDLYSLNILATVVREGSFGQAATVLNTTQSAVSYQIRKLEERLGIPLFDRSLHRATLTSAGEIVLEEGRRLLESARQIEVLTERFADGWEPNLKVIVDGILPIEPILKALKVMAEENIPTRIQVKVEFLGGVQYRFVKEHADIMLVKDYQPDPSLNEHQLEEMESILVAAREHPLSSMKQASLDDLHHYVELTVHDSSEQYVPGGDRMMFGGERIFYMSDFNSKKQALLMGLGFGWMPSFLVEKEMKEKSLIEVAYRGGSRHRFRPSLIHRAGNSLGKGGRRFRELIIGK
ncbi:MAG: LysR family transcriptional regulator [Ignavibacteriae bacterium]|nr:LysR family transcriptional regulator [Ignavibacteriota bacterium]MCB9217447.1 LysR family transcriptional regulator [Ignavibacteria bacterium]